ncbi:YWFCY domain-containing protein [Larkinella insperata]|uniref:YWFCY domain-containing protein n=1 Tax=Larkinella insperata TaxID=332158 RepID=A0ABW3QLK7_9BACT
MREERKELSKVNEIFLWATIVLLSSHVYAEMHNLFKGFGFTNVYVDKILIDLLNAFKLLGTPWTLKLLAAGAIVIYGVSSRGVKSIKLKPKSVAIDIIIGIVLFLGSTTLLLEVGRWLLDMGGMMVLATVYLTLTIIGLLYMIKGVQGIKRLMFTRIGQDTFNRENETFPQEERLVTNKHSINIATEFEYQGRKRRGWINIVNPFRGLFVVGSAGSGKTFSIINSIIRQQIEKGFAMYVYDFKFSDLSLVAFNAMVRHRKKLPKNMQFYCINFDNPLKSHRCNPLHPSYLKAIDDAEESAKMMMLNLNKTWIGKESEFFVSTPIKYVTCMIWLLRTYKKGIYCTLPHLIELLCTDYRKVFPLMVNRPDLETRSSIFVSAFIGKAMDQLEGQMASARSGPSTLSSPNIYWTMSGNDFMLDINNPEAPKIVCVGNNNLKSDTYSAALSMYNGRILNLINQKGKHRSGIVIDEIPTMYFEGIGKLINTGRDNKIAVTLALQDYSQLDAQYGKLPAEVIKNACGTVICGQASGATADAMQNRLGKNVQRKDSLNIQSEDTTHSISTELNYIAPSYKISQLSQGDFVGVVADTAEQRSDLKAFKAAVIIDKKDFIEEQKLKELPNFSIFANEGDIQQMIQDNYLQIKEDIKAFIDEETGRIADQLGISPQKP